jgi:hypothetical protein
MTLAVRVAGTLKGAAEVELRLLGIANRPAALIALKLDERFRLIASALLSHVARTHGSTAASWCDSRVDDVPAEGGYRRGRRKAHAEKNECLGRIAAMSLKRQRASGDMTDAVWYFYDEVAL